MGWGGSINIPLKSVAVGYASNLNLHEDLYGWE
jgi:hypothetical protein